MGNDDIVQYGTTGEKLINRRSLKTASNTITLNRQVH